MDSERFCRLGLVTGSEMMDDLRRCRVTVFGVGGVGSWCVEALARSAVGHIRIVDCDVVAESNINRQLPALSSTVGRPKVDVVAERIVDINPDCVIEAVKGRYSAENGAEFELEKEDYVIDAIDSLTDKADLILRCTDKSTGPRRGFYSSMGAARKLDVSKVSVAEFWKVEGCPLARALRTRFRRSGVYPRGKFKCVYSPETLPHRAESADGSNGTFAHATAVFGLTLASLVIEDLYKNPFDKN